MPAENDCVIKQPPSFINSTHPTAIYIWDISQENVHIYINVFNCYSI